MKHPPRIRPLAGRSAALVLCLALAACASAPPTEPALAASLASVEAARSAGAPELANAEMGMAQTKLERARALAREGRNVEAIRLAEQADTDAQYARAVVARERALRASTEVENGLKTLREELSRPRPVTP